MKKLTIAGILFGFGSLVGELIEFDETKETLGSIIETVAASAGAVLSVLAFREEDHGKSKRDVHFNMLAQILDRPTYSNSTYPVFVWTYLNSELPGSGTTPRQELITLWSQESLLGEKATPDDATIDRLTSSHNNTPVHLRLKMDDIEDRIRMLSDLGARVAWIKTDLRDLTRVLTADQP